MKKLLNDLTAAMMAEYGRAAKKYGPTHASAHEAYAVMREELEEAQAVQDMDIGIAFTRFWNTTKGNRPSHEYAEEIKVAAITAAAELIQLAAMAHKATLPYFSLDYAAKGGE